MRTAGRHACDRGLRTAGRRRRGVTPTAGWRASGWLPLRPVLPSGRRSSSARDLRQPGIAIGASPSGRRVSSSGRLGRGGTGGAAGTAAARAGRLAVLAGRCLGAGGGFGTGVVGVRGTATAPPRACRYGRLGGVLRGRPGGAGGNCRVGGT